MPLKQLLIGTNHGDNLSYAEQLNLKKLDTIYFNASNINNVNYVEKFVDRLQIYNDHKFKKNKDSVPYFSIYFNCVVNDSILSKLSQFKLNKLELYNTQIVGNFVENMDCKNLEVLTLGHAYMTDEKLLRLFEKLERIIHITINFGVHHKNIDTLLPSFLKFTNLQSLNISSCIITNSLLVNLKNSMLTSLYIDTCNIVENWEGIRNLKMLRILYLSHINVSDDFLLCLKDLQLSHLTLNHTQINGSGLVHLIDIPLTSLDLSCSKIKDEHVVYFSNHKLEYLYLNHCPYITPKCLKLFVSMPLSTLYLYNCPHITKKDTLFLNRDVIMDWDQ
jgi:hypothetical protein